MKYTITVSPRPEIPQTTVRSVDVTINRDDLDPEKFSKIKGKCVFTEDFPKYMDRLMDFKVRPDDIWIVSLPNCGFEYFSEMVWLIQNDFDFVKSLSSSNNLRAPHLELKALFPCADDTFTIADTLESPRILKTHLPVHFLPKDFFVRNPKIVFIYRDVKEAAVAYYYLCCAIGCFSGSKEDSIELFMSDHGPYLPFWKHLLSYDKYFANSNQILSVEYSRDKSRISVEESIQDICEFLGKSVPDVQTLEKVKEHLKMYSDRDVFEAKDQEYRFPIELEQKFNNWCQKNGMEELTFLKKK